MKERHIQDQLDKLEGSLFLDKEWDSHYQRIVYSVKHVIDGSLYTALEWRDLSGMPLSLDESFSGATLLDTLRSQEGSIKEALNSAIVNNAVRKEKLRQKALSESEEVTKEWDAHKRGRKSISTGPGSIDHKTSLNKRDV